MSTYLTVPIRMDALVVRNNEITVVNQMADFTILPYFDDKLKQEFNCDTANISEWIVSQPFQNKNLSMGAGVHLHWALPDGLTHGDAQLQFPAVPDRWLITRRKKSGNTWVVDKQWIVESNYLYPPFVDKKGVSVNIPYTSRRWYYDTTSSAWKFDATNTKIVENRAAQRHRFMGRNMPAAAWRDSSTTDEYYPSLTALGYGEPTFAAFYPNCYSVFGFHDPEPGKDLTQIKYEVAGWYSDPTLDPIYKLTLTGKPLLPAIEENFEWKLAAGQSGTPDRMLCYAGLEFSTNTVTENPAVDTLATITVANTATEAFSARIANILDDATDGKYLETIEDQIEAAQLAFQLDQKKLDTFARFHELRHQKGFKAVDGGSLWSLRKETGNAKEAPAGAEPPEDIAVLLGKLNELQRAYDQSWCEISGLRKQLFADWYKYMICVYPPERAHSYHPDPDLVKHFIEQKSLQKLEDKIRMTGKVAGLVKSAAGNITGMNATKDSARASLAYQLIAQLDALLTRLQTFEAQINATRKPNEAIHYYVDRISAPRYWQPNDPVVLIHGDAAKPSHRYGKDGVLECQLFSSPTGSSTPYSTPTAGGAHDFTALATKVNALALDEFHGLNKWIGQPWNPFLLEWQADLYPIKSKGNLEDGVGDYSPDFIADNYYADLQNPDLELKPNKGALVRSGNPYSGCAILTSKVHGFMKNLLDKHNQGLSSNVGDKNYNNPNHTLQRALEELGNSGSDNILAQSLSGFNEALLMHKQTLELDVSDPLGFDAYRAFTSSQVRTALEDHVVVAPRPLSPFSPIRAGCLKFFLLRLVDSFGQTRDLNVDRIDTTYKMTTPESRYLVRLPPRLVQPARMDFRWLDAQQGFAETNAQRSTTPICGWIVANHTDQSIVFYDSNGRALGYFKAGQWREAIDSDKAIASVSAIPNAHLRRVAEYVNGNLQDAKFIEDFISTIDDAQLNIHPEGSGNLDSLALLVGRPVAVVRARFNLELCGPAAIDNNWNVFLRDVVSNKRTTHGYTKIQFPVRLGEYGQLNDGLIGYWLETHQDGNIRFTTERRDANGNIVHTDDKLFYSPQSDYIDSKAIESEYEHDTDGPINFYQSVEDPAQYLTLLMDPRGSVHATVGVLPNKAIAIPPEHYREALQNIEISFLQAPILTPHDRIQLPLRNAIGYEWTWVEREGTQWKELFPENRIEKQAFVAGYFDLTKLTNGEEVWTYLLRPDVQWLATVDDNEDGLTDVGIAKVVSTDKRKEDPLQDIRFKNIADTIQCVLDGRSKGLDPAEYKAVFTGPQEFKEGWLKLRKTKSPTP